MLTKKITFLTIILSLTLSLLACRGLVVPTPAPSTEAEGQAIDVVTFTKEAATAPIEPTAIPVTVADTQAVSLNAAAETQEPTAPDTPAVSPAISAEPASLMTELVAIPQNEMNIRQGPGTDYPVIGNAAADESFNITGRNEDASWVQVSSETIPEGWLFADLVEITGDVLTALLVQADDIPAPPAEAEPQPAISTVEELAGTIYFGADEVGGHFDPTILEGVQAGGVYKISPDSVNLTQIQTNSMVPDGGFVLSPDGQQVAFHVRQGLVGGFLGTYSDADTYVMNIDGTGLVKLTDSPDLAEGLIGWLPDGQHLVYTQWSHDLENWPPSGDNPTNIYVLDINQATALNLAQIPRGRELYYDPSVSPNGQQLVFLSRPAPDWGPPPPGWNYVPDLPETLSVVNLDGSGRLDLLDNPAGYELQDIRWSPDSQQLALTIGVIEDVPEDAPSVDHDIHLFYADGTGPVNITNTPDANESKPVWSPYGQQLVVSCDYDRGGVYSKRETTGIQFFSRDGTAQTACIDLPDTYAAEGIKWSPDGQQVAIFTERWQVDGNLLSTPQTALFTIKADGTDLIQITDSGLDAGYDFAWSPEGQWLAFSARPRILMTGNAFVSAEQGNVFAQYKLYVSRVDGSQTTSLTEGTFGGISQVEWRP